ncbi:hypothetical protein JCM17960_18990 [Magnetospira thiophila]
MKTQALILALAVAALLAALAAPAAETPDPAAEDDPAMIATLAAKVNILTRAARLTEIPEGEPLPLDLSLLTVPGASPDLTRGVTAKAYARYVTVEDKRIGQVVLVGVEKDGRREALDSNLFSAQFELDDPRLQPAAPVTVQGDGASLIEALKRLAEHPAETPTQEEPAVIASTDDGAKPAGSNATANDPAAAYKTPDPVQLADAPTETVSVVTEGCPVRIDIEQLRAIQQSKTVTATGGVVASETPCTDGAEGFTLQRSYSVCSDLVDMEARTATAQYLLYYVDAGGARQEVTECAADSDQLFPIVETFTACTLLLDYQAQQAVPQSALIYRDSNNADVQVRGCQASETKAPVPMVRTTNGCSIRHDYAGGTSYQQGTWTYALDGITYQAGGCTDTGVEYVHEQIYEGSDGQYVCSPIVDLDGGTVTLQSRLRINVDGVKQYITECAPDTSGALPIATTTGGCDNPATWEHDLTAGVSYGEERFYYLHNGVPVYVTGCQASAAVYAHQVETAGWQNHDDQLFAYALSTVYITPPSGRYDIKTAEVLQGATQMPFELTGTDTLPNGQWEYAGCDALQLTDLVEIWRRPDGTDYEKAIGAGVPTGPTDVCVDTVTASGAYSTGYAYFQVGGFCTIFPNGEYENHPRFSAAYYYGTVNRVSRSKSWPGLFRQFLALDKWSLCRLPCCIADAGPHAGRA